VSTDEDSSGSRSSGRTDSRSTHFSQRDNPTVVRDSRQAAMVDLSSVRKKYKGEWIVGWGGVCPGGREFLRADKNCMVIMTCFSYLLLGAALTKAHVDEIEKEFQASIAEIQAELEKIQVGFCVLLLWSDRWMSPTHVFPPALDHFHCVALVATVPMLREVSIFCALNVHPAHSRTCTRRSVTKAWWTSCASAMSSWRAPRRL
jgi:hypothetical protein